MREEFIRTALMLGENAIEKLQGCSVALFGVGGVGSYVAEALARAGVGRLLLVDNDTVNPSNINRQLCALHSTLGRYKVDVVAERVKDINPLCEVEVRREFVLGDNVDSFALSCYDFVVDAIDTVSAKLAIAERCVKGGVPIISSMGTGNKLDPLAFKIADISKTSVCPLARVMRRELRARGIYHLPVLFSTEEPKVPHSTLFSESGKPTPASISFVPSVAGLVIAGEVIKTLVASDRQASDGTVGQNGKKEV